MDLILITNEPAKAAAAQEAGVDRVMVDLEVIGKEARQGHLDTVISRHTLEDVARIRGVLRTTRLLVRINPVHAASEEEIGRCLALGADVLMLPMFTGKAEVERFVASAGGRARTCLLLETPAALAQAGDILEVAGIDEVHVGLNDLHLALGLTFMFELLAGGIVEQLAGQVTRRKIKFGFGGVARLGGTGALSPRLVLSEHVRLGSTQVILSRDFHKAFEAGPAKGVASFKAAVAALRLELGRLRHAPAEELRENARELQRVVAELVRKKRSGTA